ncbi:hypothetical protein GCM10020369_29090 [Cryptosporangium minutisporangium]|uniref:Uncharacterized protein n=1 Tax=Cryptosporangium minutisporangium TaxID=113569 RepID=A0ABP6SXH5_9ACTN
MHVLHMPEPPHALGQRKCTSALHLVTPPAWPCEHAAPDGCAAPDVSPSSWELLLGAGRLQWSGDHGKTARLGQSVFVAVSVAVNLRLDAAGVAPEPASSQLARRAWDSNPR